MRGELGAKENWRPGFVDSRCWPQCRGGGWFSLRLVPTVFTAISVSHLVQKLRPNHSVNCQNILAQIQAVTKQRVWPAVPGAVPFMCASHRWRFAVLIFHVAVNWIGNRSFVTRWSMHEHACCFLFRFVKYATDVRVMVLWSVAMFCVGNQLDKKNRLFWRKYMSAGHVSVHVCWTGNYLCFCHIHCNTELVTDSACYVLTVKCCCF